MHLIKPMVPNGWGFLSTSFLLLEDEISPSGGEPALFHEEIVQDVQEEIV